MSARRRAGSTIGRAALVVIAVVVSLLFLLPVLWLLASTFRSATETFGSSSPLSWNVLWPKEFTLANLESAVN
jgi:putative chitobiose transport system permease protein